jgi:hypothetical protein
VNQQATVPRAVHFDIGRITLHGYTAGQRTRFLSSLQAHLAELAGVGGYDWPTAGKRRIGHLNAGLLRPGARPEEAAQRLAAHLIAAAAGPGGRGGRHE